MSITKTNVIAKAAAVIAGAGLVAFSFAPLANIANAQTTTTTTTTTTATFTRDLTIGSTGADVTALQTWLIAKGYSIPAGATGYFGAQTQAALAAYQAANGIAPAAGYFGPITRAKVMATATTGTVSTVPGCMPGAMFSSTTGQSCASTSTTTTTTSSTLSGGEADLSNYDLRTGDDLSEGDTDTEIATIKFDVEDGDVNVQRVRLTFQSNQTAADGSDNPWKYFDKLYVYNGSTKVGSVDAGSRDDFDSEDGDSDVSDADAYSIDIPVNTVVKEGDTAELSVRADAQSTIDSDDADQTFDLYVDDQDIRAVDAAGIQEYTGDNGSHVTVGFNGSNNGDLTVRESSDDPDAGVLVADDTNSTDNLSVLKFEVKNDADDDALLNNLTVHVATTTASGSSAHDIRNIIRRATLTVDGDDYDGDINSDNTIDFDFDGDVTVKGNDTSDFELTVDLASQTSHYAATGEALTFTVDGDDIDAEGDRSGDSIDVSGTANGNKQSIAVNGGISVQGSDNNADETYNSQTPSKSTGTFTLKFDVTAVGDDVYVPKAIQALASTTSPNASTGVVVITDLAASTTSSTVSTSLTSGADTDSDNSAFYVINDGDTESFTAQVTIDPTTQDYYQVGLDRIRFTSNSDGSSLQTLDVDQTDDQFKTDPLLIHNN